MVTREGEVGSDDLLDGDVHREFVSADLRELLQQEFSALDTERDEELVLAQVIEIYRSLAVTGVAGDLLDRGASVALLEEEAAGRIKAQISSARPLDAGQLEALRQALTRRIGTEVAIESEVDSSLIGGVVARVGGLLLDGSIRSQLDKLSERLRKGAV